MNSRGVVVGGDGTLITFDDVEPFAARSKTSLDGSAVIGIPLSTDHLEVIASTAVGSVYRVNLETMAQITISESHTGSVVTVAFPSHTSERFATASRDGSIRVWDLVDYAQLARRGTIDSALLLLLYAMQIRLFPVRLMAGMYGCMDGCCRYLSMYVCHPSDLFCYPHHNTTKPTPTTTLTSTPTPTTRSVIAHDPDTGDIQWSINDAHQGKLTSTNTYYSNVCNKWKYSI